MALSAPPSTAVSSLVELLGGTRAAGGNGHTVAVHEFSVAISDLEMIPGVPIASAAKVAAMCFVCVVLYRLISQINCNSRRLDCRTCKSIAKVLLWSGWDEFESFSLRVSVHSIQDIEGKGMLGDKKSFQVEVCFRWSEWETSATEDMRWEQTHTMLVPQGATACTIRIFRVGTFRNTCIATHHLDTKTQIIDRGDDFYGRQQKLKMEDKGKRVCKLVCTFRRKDDAEGDMLPVAGVDPDSSLAVDIIKAYEKLRSTPGFVAPPKGTKLEGANKVAVLAAVLEGTLRQVDDQGKDQGNIYVRVIGCNYAELQGKHMKEAWQKQLEKAKKKGLAAPERKWYWVWYGNEEHADDEKKWHHPDGFIPLTSFANVLTSPGRNDQFIVKYHGGETDSLIYRREGGKGLDTWVDGLEMIFRDVREEVKQRKDGEKTKEEALQRMRHLHGEYVKRLGVPQSNEQWTKWFEYFKAQGYDEELIKFLYNESVQARK